MYILSNSQVLYLLYCGVFLFVFGLLLTIVTLKQKNTYYKNGEKTIILSHVENLGDFIEVEEYPSISNLIDTEKIDILKQYINSFNFKIGSDYSCKKVYMLYLKK